MKNLLFSLLRNFGKLTLLFCISLMLFFTGASAQTTETFGPQPCSMDYFWSNWHDPSSVRFTIEGGSYIHCLAFHGYLNSNAFIDNYNVSISSCKIKSTSTFSVKSLYLYPSDDLGGSTNQTSGVNVTLTGKLAGTTKFTYSPPSSDFASASYTNVTDRGFSLVNFATPGYDNIAIDELVITPGGTTVYLGIDNFTWAWAPLPTVSGISPTSGNTAGGTSVIITGTNFTGATAVKFGSTDAAGYTVNSATQITATSPAGAAGAVDITVATAAGTSSTISSDQFTYNAGATITSFSPLTGPVGTTVTITGTCFNTAPANNIVFFGATKATVSAATTTSLTVTVPSGATYAPITVLNTGTNLAAYSSANFNPTFTPNKGSISTSDFADKVDFATNSIPYSVALGDIDGDGKPDLVFVNSGSNNVSVLLNTGNSGSISFATKVDFATGDRPWGVAIGDIDGDGKPDLVIANYDANTMSVLRNTSSSGSISFAAKIDFTTGIMPYGVAIGDIDGDGKPDIALAMLGGVSVLRNTSSSGSITFATHSDIATGTGSCSVAIGDLDGDSKPDLVIANYNEYTVSVLRNTGSSGSISFADQVDFATGIHPHVVRIGDIDGDGKLDLAVANESSNTVSVLRNMSTIGSISFDTKSDFTTGYLPYSVTIGDIDGDGKPDLVSTNSGAGTMSILRNTSSSGSISFTGKVDLTANAGPRSVAIGDLDGDGKPDLAVINEASNNVSVFRNKPQIQPVISSFSPLTGPVGTLVTITGIFLSNPSAFTIGGVNAIVVSNDGTSLVGMVMPGATTGIVTVTTAEGTANGADTFTVTATPFPAVQQGSKLVGTGNTGTANQGTSVSVSADGNTAIVGGYQDNSGQGAAWIYTRSGSTWTQQGSKLVGTGNTGAAYQGFSVSISANGNTAIVGGYGDNSNQGAAWIYTRSGSTWTQQGSKLVGTGNTGAAYQGCSVSLSADGNTAMVGGYGDNSNQGAAWVYTRSGSTWTQQGSKLVGTGNTGAAYHGCSVSLSADGNTAMVGGYGDNSNQGAAWVYTRSGGTWTQQGSKLVGTGNLGAAYQGCSVSISADGNTAIVGGYTDNNYEGAAWVYTRSGGIWSQQGSKLVGSGGWNIAVSQGASVCLSADGNTAMVGGYEDNNYEGAVWVFTRSGSTWTQQGSKLVGTGNAGTTSDQGISVSLSANGNTAMVGGNYDNNGQGAAWIFIPEVSPTTQASAITDDALLLYPNPATDGFTINTGEKITTVSIYNLSGILVLAQQAIGNTFINISSLHPGVYVVKANRLAVKLVKE